MKKTKMKLIKVIKEPTHEASWDTWCLQCSCHCSYLADISDVRCKSCEQERVTTEYKLVKD